MKAKGGSESNEQAPIPDPSAAPTNRDPEDREVNRRREHEVKDKMMDKTLADSYPASDPPSTIPHPGEEDSLDKKDDKAA
jgi:hypothetical protein